MPKLSETEQNAIHDFLLTRLPILCAAGSRATETIDATAGRFTFKPILYFARSANMQRVIGSNPFAVAKTVTQANRVIRL